MNGFGMNAHPAMMYPHHDSHGFCHSCCHPVSQCCCGHRQCRKEAKELLVSAQAAEDKPGTTSISGIRTYSYVSADVGDEDTDIASSALSDLMRIVKGAGPAGAGVNLRGNIGASADVDVADTNTNATNLTRNAANLTTNTRIDAVSTARQPTAGAGVAFIGGGCCVHLSVEYMSTNANAVVAVLVIDSENTALVWMKSAIQPGYYIKEGIISTKPGAILGVVVVNAIARVRWCEVFSC